MRKNEYLVSKLESVASSGTLVFLAQTNGGNVEFQPSSVESDSSPILVELFEITNPTDVSVEGTPVVSSPTNFINTRTPNTNVYSAPTVNLVPYTAKYVGLAGGTQKVGGGTSSNLTLYLKKNTYYVYRITNNSVQTANIVVNFLWKEHAS